MPQYTVWENEYKNPKLITNSDEPSGDFKRFIKFLRKDCKVTLEGLRVLDIGSGAGKHTIFLAERGSKVTGMEISDTALSLAKKRAKKSGVDDNVKFIKHDIGTVYPFKNSEFDLVLDIMSSNSLNEAGRQVYLKEVDRTLKPDGYFFVRALCKDGDKNAQNLLEKSPGPERDTYKIPEFGLVERVFSEEDFRKLYSTYFKVLSLTRKSGYSIFKGKTYKRNYWLAYMQK